MGPPVPKRLIFLYICSHGLQAVNSNYWFMLSRKFREVSVHSDPLGSF